MRTAPLVRREYVVPSAKLPDYYEALQYLHKLNQDVFATLHFQSFENEILEFFLEAKRLETSPSDEEVKEFLKRLTIKPVELIRVFAGVSGARVKGDFPLVLGPYTLYDKERHGEQLELASYNLAKATNMDLEPFSTLICVEFAGRDCLKIRERATDTFERFENVVSFMVNNRTNGSGVRVSTGATRAQHLYTFAPSGDKTVAMRQLDIGAWVTIDDPYFTKAEFGHQYIWNLLAQDEGSRNQIQKRILRAIDWAGQALHERSSANALLKSAIAIEALLSHSKDQVVKTISEYTAQICGRSVEGRLEVEKHMKLLYATRSNLVHGSSSQATRDEAQAFLNYTTTSIERFLVDKDLQALTTESDMVSHFAQLRYSAPSSD